MSQAVVNDRPIYPLLLGSMYFWFWLIQLNRSYKNNGKFARTGISTLNGHISKPVALREKLKKIRCNDGDFGGDGYGGIGDDDDDGGGDDDGGKWLLAI